MSGLSIQPVGNPWLIGGVALFLVALLLVRPQHVKFRPLQTATLIFLRLLVIALTLVAMLRPTWIYTEKKPQKASILMLLDASRSMQVADSLGNASRWSAMESLLTDSQPELEKIGATIDLKAFAFAEELSPIGFSAGHLQLPAEPLGQQSALGAALEDVLDRESSSRVLAIIALSDGAQRATPPREVAPQLAAARAGDEGIPLYTFAFGQPNAGGRADLRIDDLATSSTVFALAPTEVHGQLVARGFANQPVRVQLLWETSPGKMEVVRTVELTAGLEDKPIPITLRFTPPEPGEFKVALRAEPREGELVTSNNEAGTFVTVRAGGINVLYLVGAKRIGGGPGLEQRFVRAALAASHDIVVNRRLYNYVQPEQSLGDLLVPGETDVVVLEDLDQIALDQASWERIVDFVAEGGGLMVLGGYHSFGPGGYRGLPIDRVLPVDIGFAERQNFGEPLRDDVHIQGPLRMRPTVPLGERHPIMQIDSESATNVWKNLPLLDGANLFDRNHLKPNAMVLAESDDAAAHPLLVSGQAAAGRTLAFAGDSTWHWPMEGFADAHRRFWRQCILWLAKKDALEKDEVWLQLPTRRVERGRRLEFSFGANSALYTPIESANFDLEIETPSGERLAARPVRRGNQWSATFSKTTAPGDYTVHVTATDDSADGGQKIGTAQARFLVPDQDLELDRPAAEPGLMAQLAELTATAGGKAMAPEELPGLLKQLADKPPEVKEEVLARITYWDTWPFLLLFVALLTLEWFLRKRWGLV